MGPRRRRCREPADDEGGAEGVGRRGRQGSQDDGQVGRLRETGNAQRDDDSVSVGGAAVADLLEEMPAWSEVATGDRPGLRQVEEAVYRVHRFGTEAVKDGLRRFVAVRARSPGGLDVADMSKLYVLIRYMYDAPQRAPKDKTSIWLVPRRPGHPRHR